MTEQERDSVDKNEPGKLARAVVAELDPAQREVLADYMASLILLRQRELPAQTKVLDSIDLTADRQVLGVLTKGSGRLLAKHAWKDRSWAARIGLSAAALASILTAGQGAGIALLGTAVGVPLWIVFGAGGTFAGALIDEVARSRTGVERPADTAPSTDRTRPQARTRILSMSTRSSTNWRLSSPVKPMRSGSTRSWGSSPTRSTWSGSVSSSSKKRSDRVGTRVAAPEVVAQAEAVRA